MRIIFFVTAIVFSINAGAAIDEEAERTSAVQTSSVVREGFAPLTAPILGYPLVSAGAGSGSSSDLEGVGFNLFSRSSERSALHLLGSDGIPTRFLHNYITQSAGGSPPSPPFGVLPEPLLLPRLLDLCLSPLPDLSGYLNHNFNNFLRDFLLYRDSRRNFRIFTDWTHWGLRILQNPSPALDATPPVDQEALTAEGGKIQDNYVKMATEGESSVHITKLLPSPDEVEEVFMQSVEDLKSFLELWESPKLDDSTKFRITNAKRTLQLMQGDPFIERHPISSVDRYATYSYPGMPNIRQLLVLAQRLGNPDPKDFVESMIAENWRTAEDWRAFQKIFINTRFREIVSYEDAGYALRADREKGRPLVSAIAKVLQGDDTLPVVGSQRLMQQFMKRFLLKRTEQVVPLLEALGMVMRGHNVKLLDPAEPNKPACAEGAYLGLLRAVGEMVSYQGTPFLLTINDCALATLAVLNPA